MVRQLPPRARFLAATVDFGPNAHPKTTRRQSGQTTPVLIIRSGFATRPSMRASSRLCSWDLRRGRFPTWGLSSVSGLSAGSGNRTPDRHHSGGSVDDSSCSPSLRRPGPDRKTTGFVAAIVLVATVIAAAVMRTAGGRELDGIRLADAVQTTGCA